MSNKLFLFIILIVSCNLLFSSCKKEENEKVSLTNADIEGQWNVDKYVVTVFSDKETVTMTNTNFTFRIDGTCQVNYDAEYTDLFNYLFNLETWEINKANQSEIIFNRGTSLQRTLTVKSISRSNMKIELIDSSLGLKIVYLMDFSR